MGAEQFQDFSSGKTAKEAFISARDQAAYDYGHAGYTGTLAEKSEFTMIGNAASAEAATEMAEKLIREGDERIDDKWGPAGCIQIDGTDKFLFFGWASS